MWICKLLLYRKGITINFASKSSIATSLKNKIIACKDLGSKSYKESWEYQEMLFQDILSIKKSNSREKTNVPTPNYFLFVEHPHVYTLGKSGHVENLLVSTESLGSMGIEFFKTNRGGDITYHGPGQIVGYPIFDLENFFTDVHKYLRFLEEVIILTLKEYDINGERSAGETGVWIEPNTARARKICAMGVRASRWVTMHGFALNVNTDLNYFNYMIPCGIKNKGVTSLQEELKKTVPLEEIKEKILRHLQVLFEAELQLSSETVSKVL